MKKYLFPLIQRTSVEQAAQDTFGIRTAKTMWSYSPFRDQFWIWSDQSDSCIWRSLSSFNTRCKLGLMYVNISPHKVLKKGNFFLRYCCCHWSCTSVYYWPLYNISITAGLQTFLLIRHVCVRRADSLRGPSLLFKGGAALKDGLLIIGMFYSIHLLILLCEGCMTFSTHVSPSAAALSERDGESQWCIFIT